MPATKSKHNTPRPVAARKRPAARRPRKATPPTRARRTQLASRRILHPLRDLGPQQVDLVALGLIALSVFLGGVAYFGWAGGALGHGLISVLRLLVGVLAYGVPVLLALVGLRLLARNAAFVPAGRPLRAGAICLAVAVSLGLAAGTLGIGPGRTPVHGAWAGPVLRARGGVFGGLEYALAHRLVSAAGAEVIAIFLGVAGLLLISGATVGSIARFSRRNAARALAHADFGVSATQRAEIRARRLRETSRYQDDRHDLDAHAGSHSTAELELDEVPEFDGGEAGEGSDRTALNVLDLTGEQPEPAEVYEDPNGQRSFGVEEGSAPAGADPEAEPWDAADAADELGPAGPQREVNADDLTPAGRYRAAVIDDPDFIWRLPSPKFLVRSRGDAAKPDTAAQAKTAKALVDALANFGVESKVIGQVSGPHITRYELRLAPGVKMSKVSNLKDDLAYALAATDIRILAPIPGKTAVGVEVPNARRRIVHLGDVYQSAPDGWSPLTVWLGKDIAGRSIGADLAKMPHLLVAGTTGAGKSACVNAMLCSLLLGSDPHQVRLVLVDPKQVELNHYDALPHLLTPVITSPRMAANALANLVKEMEDRYSIMQLARTRSLPDLNKVRAGRGEPALPYILCVIDELADLMMVAPAEVEDSIIRLAQKARAVGIHLVLATQSPRVDVITGMIKANVPSRIAFAVSSQTDSRVILDQNGAESLLGQGDMLFSPVGTNRLQRIQGAFIDEEQIAHLTDQWRRQGEPEFREELLSEVEDEEDAGAGGSESSLDPDEDPLLGEAVSLVAQMGTASTSMLQRRLRLGYTRAGRLIDMLERRGIISGYEGSKPRQVLITEADVPRILVALSGVAGSAEGRSEVAAGELAATDEDAELDPTDRSV